MAQNSPGSGSYVPLSASSTPDASWPPPPGGSAEPPPPPGGSNGPARPGVSGGPDAPLLIRDPEDGVAASSRGRGQPTGGGQSSDNRGSGEESDRFGRQAAGFGFPTALAGLQFGTEVDVTRTLRQNQFGIRLRICCEVLLFLGCVHLGIFPDWWNGVTDIGVAILLSTSLFRRASLSTLVSVVLLSFLNSLVQIVALLSLLKIELFQRDEIPKSERFLFLAYLVLIFFDTVTMLVTGNASAMLLREVLQIILRQEENDIENPFAANGGSAAARGPQAPVTPAVGQGQHRGEALQPFQGQAFTLPD